MIKNYLLFIAACQVLSQEFFLNTVKSFTKYLGGNILGQSNSNLQLSLGNFREIGLMNPFGIRRIFNSVGFSHSFFQ